MKTSLVASSRLVVSLLASAPCLLTAFLAQADSTNCLPPPQGLVSWWQGEGTAADPVGGNSGTLEGDASYGPGKVGQALVFDGNQDGIEVGTAANLQLQDFTIEAWIKRSSSTVVSFNGNGNGELFVLGGVNGGYGFRVKSGGALGLGKSQVNEVSSAAQVANTNWHHVAVTKSNTSVFFYVDGVKYAAPSYNSGGFVFDEPGHIGAWRNPSSQLDNSFYGAIDELAIDDHALLPAEIQAIYQTGSAGKCSDPAPPVIIVQPTNQAVLPGDSVSFAVKALGTPALTYQWAFNGTNISGANDFTILINDVQASNAGSYSVVVSNDYGFAVSSNAVLTIDPFLGCTTPTSGLVSWWRAEGAASDWVSGNNGTLSGDTVFGAGASGQGFVFDGNADGIQLGNPPNLRFQNLTIEAWIKRASATVSSLTNNEAAFVSYGNGGYGFTLFDNGNLSLTRVGVSSVIVAAGLTDTLWHHVAVTRSNSVVVFYVDGTAYPAAAYNPTFTFTSTIGIGVANNLAYNFYGSMDEVAVYNRALTATEIQTIYNARAAGKCSILVPPVIVSQPQTTNGFAGVNLTLSVAAGGSLPLSCQWRLNGTNLVSATNATLTLTNLQFGQTGDYSVQVTNSAGSVVSSNATLTVSFPNAVVRAGSTNVMAGQPVVVPITVVVNGNENSFGFSLNFSTQRLAFASATLGSGANGAALLVNTSLTATGRLGLAVTLPAQSNFTPGTQEVARVTFSSFPLTGVTTNVNTVSFADQPVLRELSDAQLQSLPANYSNGTVRLAPTVFESDLSPRTNGNQIVSTTDWLQAGRFVARLDTTAANEFQRADSAPRATLGDGQLKVTDWVQAGRYLAGLDPLAALGGPLSETIPTLAGASASRQLRVVNANVPQAQVVNVAVNLEAQGDENAVGFTFAFDSSAFAFVGVTAGSDAVGANFTPNSSQAGSGRLGVALALPTGSAFTAGAKELAIISLLPIPAATGIFPASLTDQLVTRCVSDLQAGELAVTCLNGNITVNSTNPPPSLAIALANTNVVISWPAWAGDFALQMADAIDGLPAAWTNVPGALQTNGGNILSTQPLTNQTKLFRLRR